MTSLKPYGLLFLIILLASCHLQKKDTPTELNKSISHNYVNIPGTHMAIMPPAGFTIKPNRLGLAKFDGGKVVVEIQFADTKKVPFKFFTKEDFEKINSYTILQVQRVMVDGYDGEYVETEGPVFGYKFATYFGDSTFFASLICLGTEKGDAQNEEIKKAMLNVRYDKNGVISH
jgi:hypothetical protein